jgi:predicted ATP-dependent endonuclease of OLD family
VHIRSFRVENFRRLKDIRIDFDQDTTTFVGANNSGKTSATHVFQLFMGKMRAEFQIYDFSADCWEQFNSFDVDTGNPDTDLPRITLDLWLDVDYANAHRVVNLLPSLDWSGEPVGVRLQFAPRSGQTLVQNFTEARTTASLLEAQQHASWKPWPENLTNYLAKQLRAEYEIKYLVLDFRSCGADLKPRAGYEPYLLGTAESGAAKLIESLIRIDFLNAQRYLSDTESRGRDEELSKRLSRFYIRNLEKCEDDIEALNAVTESEAKLNAHFADVFKPTLDRLAQLGYPGISDPGLVVKASLDAASILNANARVHYSLPPGSNGETGTGIFTLPDQYNGLGFKNLIYMVVEILDFHHSWIDGLEEHPPIHMVMIEEPEVHLHAQLQQVFIRKIREILPPTSPDFITQFVVTTHSPHIIYEQTFQHIRYFKRGGGDGDLRHSEVRNLSGFYDGEEAATRNFLLQYLRLTHCDLFFADAAVLVEGNVERLLLPLIIQKTTPELRACHLTILEVGGAFSHKFQKLIEFLELPMLVITDLDSVHPENETTEEDAGNVDKTGKSKPGSSCMTTYLGAITSNETLKQWLPKCNSIQDLLALDDAEKRLARRDGEPAHIRVAYETLQPAAWCGSSRQLAGRTFEEAFALQNLDWCQASEQKSLGLHISKANELDLAALHEKIYSRVKGFDKTGFALGLIGADINAWSAPQYIVDGLQWLSEILQVEPMLVAEAIEVVPLIDCEVNE